MPAPSGRASATPPTKNAPAPAAAMQAPPGPVAASLSWRPLLSQLSNEMDRLESENRKFREQLGLGPAATSCFYDDVQEIRGPPAQVVRPPEIPTNSRKVADDSWSLALRSKGLLRTPGSMGLRNQWMEPEGTGSVNSLAFAPQSEASRYSRSTAGGSPSLPGSPAEVLGGNVSRSLSSTMRGGSNNSKISKLLHPPQNVSFSIMRAQKTKQFVSAKPWYVINPDSSQLASVWQVILVICALFVALVTPVQVGLLRLNLDTLFFISLGVDVIFFIDMLLQFLTSYPKTTPRGVVWEVRLTKICMNYLKTWFVLDFVTLIPFELFTLSLGVEELRELTAIKILRGLRLVKLLRLAKSSRLIQDLEVPWSIPYQQMALARFVLVLGLMCHWLACLWAMTLLFVDPQYPQWIDGIQEADAAHGISTRDSPYRIYVASFYFCTYTLTSVGYGDIGPQNILERVFLSVVVLIAGLSWAYVIGEVGSIVHDITKESQEFRKRMHHLNQMMKDQGLPFHLQCRLRRFFLQNKHQAIYKARQALMERMSPQLRAEACIAINLGWLQKVSFFKQFMQHIEDMDWAGEFTGPHRACVYDISRSLQLQAFAQQESFDNVQVLFILSKGLVALNKRVGSHGEVWGEDFVLSDTSLIQPVSGYALTYIELLSLTREDFMKVIDHRRWTCPELARIVRRYSIRVAVYRGILAEARRRLMIMKSSYTEISKISQSTETDQLAPPKVSPGVTLPGEIIPEGIH